MQRLQKSMLGSLTGLPNDSGCIGVRCCRNKGLARTFPNTTTRRIAWTACHEKYQNTILKNSAQNSFYPPQKCIRTQRASPTRDSMHTRLYYVHLHCLSSGESNSEGSTMQISKVEVNHVTVFRVRALSSSPFATIMNNVITKHCDLSEQV